MKLRIQSICDKGSYQDEHVVLQVIEDCDLGSYLLAVTTHTGPVAVSPSLRHVYWFPETPIRRGDVIHLYSRAANQEDAERSRLDAVHRFFWGLEVAIWDSPDMCAVLGEIATWAPFLPGSQVKWVQPRS